MNRVEVAWYPRFNIVGLNNLKFFRVACGLGSENALGPSLVMAGGKIVLDRVGRDAGVDGIEGLMTATTQRDWWMCALGRSGGAALCLAEREDKSDTIWLRPETMKEREGDEF